MKLSLPVALFASCAFLSTVAVEGTSLGGAAIAREDEQFWDRFLQFTGSMSSEFPSVAPSSEPSVAPSPAPSAEPSPAPSAEPSPAPSAEPSPAPSEEPSPAPSAMPSPSPSSEPTPVPSAAPSPSPSEEPSPAPSSEPTITASFGPTPAPSAAPSPQPSVEPSPAPSAEPSLVPSAEPSLVPSAEPSPAPSSEPTATPSLAPSAEPSSVPSSEPTATPSLVPSAEPSSEPTSVPTTTPSLVPSAEPSSVPTSVPTSTPSLVPSAEPTPAPSSEPTEAPSPAPSSEPSSQPTTECILEVDLECIIGSGTFAGQPCESPGITVEPCLQRPFGATMLYNGGSCEQSDNRQFLKFTCEDTEFGPPPTEDGAMSYIIVTDAKGKGIVYHRDWVPVGNNYYLRTPEDEDRFEADQRIQIYSSNVTSQENLLQVVQYHSSCSSNLELKNRFGASQLVEFINELQGNVSCFAAATFDFDIVIPIDIDGDSAELVSLTALTNFAGFLDLSDQVQGMTVGPGESVTVTVPVEFDLTTRKRYTLLVQITANEIPTGQLCTGTDFESFLAGNPGNTGPTAMPTRAPTISPAPTPDPVTTECSVETLIRCNSLTREGQVFRDCDSIVDPRTVVCTGDSEATGLGFRYLGGVGFPDTVWIQISGGRTGVVFNQAVSLNEVFYAEGDWRGEADMEISTVMNGGQGNTIDDLTVNCECAEGDTALTLTNIIGPFELTAFRNAFGYRTSIFDVRVQYFVTNAGLLTMIAEDAFVNSDFQNGPFDAIADDQTVAGGISLRVFEEMTLIDMGAKFANGVTYTFAMNATGRGDVSNLPCSAEATFTF